MGTERVITEDFMNKDGYYEPDGCNWKTFLKKESALVLSISVST
jgi:hypothetical protein